MVQNMNMKQNGYMNKDIEAGRRYLAEESRCLEVAQKSDLKATEWAFLFGQKLWVDVLKEKRGERHGGNLQKYLKEVGFKKDTSTAYRYIWLYRGARNLEAIRSSGLSRAYLTRVGQTLWTDNPIFDTIGTRLVVNPIRKETEQDTLRLLDEVCSVVEVARARIAKLKTIKTLSKTPWRNGNINEVEGDESVVASARAVNARLKSFRTLTKAPWRNGIMYKIEGDEDEIAKAAKINLELEKNVARLIGRHDKAAHYLIKDCLYRAKTPADMDQPHSAKMINMTVHKLESIEQILSEADHSAIQTIDNNLIHGDSLLILKDRSLFPERSVDCVLTDPPYSEEDYVPERAHTRVKHQAPAKATDAAELAASVAQLLLKKKINRTRFCWIQFCPLRRVHVCLPPLLEAFRKAGHEPKYQVLVWDKCIPARVGGGETFGSQAEAILHLSIDRPLPVEDSDGSRIFSPIFRVQQPKKGKELDAWKPTELLEQILWLAMYGADKSKHAGKQRVLDPFAGRGTTGIAAMRLGRLYTLIEVDSDQHAIAKANLLEASNGQSKSP